MHCSVYPIDTIVYSDPFAKSISVVGCASVFWSPSKSHPKIQIQIPWIAYTVCELQILSTQFTSYCSYCPIFFEHFRIAYFHPSFVLVSITKCSWINNKMFYEIFLFTRFNFSTRQSFLCIEFYTTAKIVWERKLSAKTGRCWKKGQKVFIAFLSYRNGHFLSYSAGIVDVIRLFCSVNFCVFLHAQCRNRIVYVIVWLRLCSYTPNETTITQHNAITIVAWKKHQNSLFQLSLSTWMNGKNSNAVMGIETST